MKIQTGIKALTVKDDLTGAPLASQQRRHITCGCREILASLSNVQFTTVSRVPYSILTVYSMNSIQIQPHITDTHRYDSLYRSKQLVQSAAM